MMNEKVIRKELKRFEGYIDNPEFCKEADDNPMYKGIVKALSWVLIEG